MVSTGEIKRGMTIELDGRVWQILEFQHIKMGRGSAQVRMKLRDIRRGDIVERTFQAGERFPRARLDHRTVQFLYSDGTHHHFMDTRSYDQIALDEEQLGGAESYLTPNAQVQLALYQGEPIGVELPPSVELQVTATEPGVKGDTATGAMKRATLETGLVVGVPLFVNLGDRIRVDTRSGEYLERA